MEDWIRENLNVIVPFPYDKEEFISFMYNGRQTMIWLPSFLNYVKGLETPLTYEKLIFVDELDKYGWHPFFEEWKKQGLIE